MAPIFKTTCLLAVTMMILCSGQLSLGQNIPSQSPPTPATPAVVTSTPLPDNSGRTSPANCTTTLNTRRQYITSINNITRTILANFGRTTAIFRPLTTPMATNLYVNPLLTRPNTTITSLSQPILEQNGKPIRTLAATMHTVVEQWNAAEQTFLELNNSTFTTRRPFIAAVNQITRATFTELGRNQTRLLPVTNSLSVQLSFSPVNLLGYTLYNTNQNISKTGDNLLMLAGNLTEMVDLWHSTTNQFLDQELQECQYVVPAHPEGRQPGQPEPVVNGNGTIDQQCVLSRPTNRTLITSINLSTQTIMTDFGRTHPRLQALSTSIWGGLNFAVVNQRGIAAYNYAQNLATTAEDMKQFANAILDMINEWEQIQLEFIKEVNRDCRINATTVANATTASDVSGSSTVVPETSSVNAEASTAVSEASSVVAEESSAAPETSSVVDEESSASATAEVSESQFIDGSTPSDGGDLSNEESLAKVQSLLFDRQ